MRITDAMLAEYLRRSYQAVDGLWFMMAEQDSSVEHALALDRRVWEVLAKIQARKARDLTASRGNSPQELADCFALKLTADGHEFDVAAGPDRVHVTIRDCPWLRLLQKSDRRSLAERIAQAICPTEGRVWCADFGDRYEFEMPSMACQGESGCEMAFRVRNLAARTD